MNIIRYITLFIIGLSLYSCVITRYEEDYHTKTYKDTTKTTIIQNSPKGRDNGVIFPSTRVVKEEREILQQELLIERKYPAFIRLGFFESIGTIGFNYDNPIGTGLFGIMPDYNIFDKLKKEDKNYIFSGGIYRWGIYERKIDVFDESPSWTVGITAFEQIMPNSDVDNLLSGIGVLSLRKRFFLYDKIPYLSLTPALSFSFLGPSTYVNLSGSLDLGSLGGLNLRTYIGMAIGETKLTFLKKIFDNQATNSSIGVFYPYIGLGASYMDFLNIDEDLNIEWKDYKHSSWEIGILQFNALITDASESYGYNRNLGSDISIFKGGQLKFINSDIAMPYFDYKLYAGTTLLSYTTLGYQETALNILPIRIGYIQNLLKDELKYEPSIELGLYPMTTLNLNNRLVFDFSEYINLAVNLGFIYGKQSDISEKLLNEKNEPLKDFSRFYLGIGIGILDRVFKKDELRYFK